MFQLLKHAYGPRARTVRASCMARGSGSLQTRFDGSAARVFDPGTRRWSKDSDGPMRPFMSSPNLSPAITADFEQVVLQHLDAAYRLARWLVANDHDAEEVF